MDISKILKFTIYFSIAGFSGFYAFSHFATIANEARLPSSLVLLDTVVFLPLWFLSFNYREDFVRNNFFLVVIGPLIALYAGNIITLVLLPDASVSVMKNFFMSSLGLIIFSRLSAKTLNEEKDESKEPEDLL